ARSDGGPTGKGHAAAAKTSLSRMRQAFGARHLPLLLGALQGCRPQPVAFGALRAARPRRRGRGRDAAAARPATAARGRMTRSRPGRFIPNSVADFIAAGALAELPSKSPPQRWTAGEVVL